MLLFPEFNPVAVQLGPIAIHWYGLAYVVALIAGLYYAKFLAGKHPAAPTRRHPGKLDADTMESLFTWVALGVILGGRLGYVLFYAPEHFLFHPLDIFKVWQGGMSFHGGFLGVTLAIFGFCHKNRLHPADVADRVAPVVPIGLFLGRMANFINGELVGRPAPADLPWSMIFPHIDLQPRHPSQLYEAGLEGLLLGLALWWVIRTYGVRRWLPTGIFITGYGLARFVVEYFRTPEIMHQWGIVTLTQGQLLSLPMILIGLALIARSLPHPPINIIK